MPIQDRISVLWPIVTWKKDNASFSQMFNVKAFAVGQRLGDNSIGMSAGEAYYPADGRDAEDLLAQADRRMYQVKQAQKVDATKQDFGVLARALAESSAVLD
jgi:GGDEF domain-containing protein